MLNRLLLSALALAASRSPPAVAAACSCVEVTPEAAFGAADAVFEGRVTAVREEADARIATLSVVQQWKGVETEAIEVRTPLAGSMCGLGFEAETSWLIYAERRGDALHTGLCARTRRVEDADDDRAFLGAGEVPVEIGPADEVEPAAPRPAASRRAGCASCGVAPATTRPWALSGLLALLGLALWRRR